MSAIGVGLTIGANALILGGGFKALEAATGGFGTDDAEAARKASAIQARAANRAAGIAEGATEEAAAGLDPFAEAGVQGVQAQQALAGLLGPGAQQQAIAQLEGSPEFAAMLQQGEEAILANASATGGLRGGNTQAALAQFRPQLLSQLINQQFGRLGGLAGAGQQAATSQGGFGLTGAGMQGDFIGQGAAARAGGILGQQAALSSGRREAIGLGIQAAGTGVKLATGGAF